MKAKIDDGGALYLERDGEFKEQLCPFQQAAFCGDWCPLFAVYNPNTISLCKKDWFVSKIIRENDAEE